MLHPEATAGRYVRSAILGRGSSATVYRAHDQLLDRPVALKEIHLPNARSVLLAEARAAAGISHQNVVTVHDIVTDESGAYIAMELLEGPTLAELLQQGPMGHHEALRVACDIAAALDAAHRRGVVHCDIKPDNVFVTSAGRTVVTDFGLAAPELGGGTPGYMAPEQYHGAPPDPAMDVFAWACVTVELLCGLPPFGLHAAEAQERTLYTAPAFSPAQAAFLPGLPELLERCLDKDPARRPTDGSALLAALAVAVSQAPPLTVPTVRDAQTEVSTSLSKEVYDPAYRPTPAVVGSPLIRLVVHTEGEQPWTWDLAVGDGVEAGREASLALADPQASRRHASFYFDGTHLHVADLGSLNGTWWNGQPISECYALPGDVISIGSTTIAIEGGLVP